MGKPALLISKIAVISSIVYAVCALLLLVYAGELSRDTYRLFAAAERIMRMPQGVLFAGVIFSALAEELCCK